MRIHDVELEQSLCRRFIDQPEEFALVELKLDDFIDPLARDIFRAMSHLAADGEPVDLVGIAGRINRTAAELSDWVGKSVPVGDVEFYAKRLRELTVARKLRASFDKLEGPEELISLMRELEIDLKADKMFDLEELLEDYAERWEEKQKLLADTGAIGLVTGFERLDQKVSMLPGNLVILGARSSVGKSSLAMNMAVNAAMLGQNVLFFSGEMQAHELMDRILAGLTGIHATKFKYADTDAGLLQGRKELASIPKGRLRLMYKPRLTTHDVCRIAKQIARKHKVEFVIVDYLQYLADTKDRGENDNLRIAGMTRRLKNLAGELGCVVLALSQVNRQASGGTGMPELYHLRDSGAIEQDADVVLLLNRENRSSVTGILRVAKNRSGQSDLGIMLDFKPETTVFTESTEPARVAEEEFEGLIE